MSLNDHRTLPLSPPNWDSKTQNGRFSSKIALRLKKICYKVSLCENCQRQSCRVFIGLTIHAKIVGGGIFTWNFWSNWPRWSEIADFRPIFARSASAVTSSEKVQLSLIGSPLRDFQWAQDEHRTLSLSTQNVAQKRKVSKIWTISCDNSATVRDRLSVTINHIESRIRAFDWYRPRWPWMTLNGVIALFAFFTEFDCFAGQIRHSDWI